MLVLEPQGAYGPKLRVAEKPRTPVPDGYQRAISFVAENLGSKGVSELEALSTALMVTLEGETGNRQERLMELNASHRRLRRDQGPSRY